MKVINLMNEELTYRPAIESHNYVLKQCEEVESLYNVEIVLTHNNAMEYSIEIRDLETWLPIQNYKMNTPGKTKNYLKGLIEAHKLQLK